MMQQASESSGPDSIFSDPRLARIYDDFEDSRDDLAVYADLVDELKARSVLDIGCGTGTFALMLAEQGIEVVAVDPAAASLAIARTKPGAEMVRWIAGDATSVSNVDVDLVTMTANVAQVFLSDEDWARTLSAIAGSLRPGGGLVFEVRDPADMAWQSWTPESSYSTVNLAEIGTVDSWVELIEVDDQFVSFRWTFRFEHSGEVLTSDSTLRFRGKAEVELSLRDAGFEVVDVRDAPDRPGRELVFIAQLAD
jgi:SAM-dependent methyltransferase